MKYFAEEQVLVILPGSFGSRGIEFWIRWRHLRKSPGASDHPRDAESAVAVQFEVPPLVEGVILNGLQAVKDPA